MALQDKQSLEKIELQIDEIHTAIQAMDNDRSTWNDSWEEYQRKREPYHKRLGILDRQFRMLVEPTFKEISNYGDVMSLTSFKEACNDGMFMDYDGIGFYVRDGKESDIAIRPSDFENYSVRSDFDTIVWFNR